MYYNDYEDYMRNVLGYCPNCQNSRSPYDNSYEQNFYGSMPNTYTNDRGMQLQDNIEDLYPDIYKIIFPMVCKVCQNNTRPITNQLVDEMTMEIYNNIEADNINIVNVNVETRSSDNKNDLRTQKQTVKSSEDRTVSGSSEERIENRITEETRQRRPNNPLLRNLIRILILERLFGGFRPPRPPVRPPFPGPGMPGRPPMRPRYQSEYEADVTTNMYGYDNFLKF